MHACVRACVRARMRVCVCNIYACLCDLWPNPPPFLAGLLCIRTCNLFIIPYPHTIMNAYMHPAWDERNSCAWPILLKGILERVTSGPEGWKQISGC